MLCSLIIFLPAFSLLYFILFSNFLGISYVYLSILVSFVIAVFSILIFFNVINNHYIYYIKVSDWADYYDFFASIDFVFDELSSIMLIIVVLIALFVQSFSKWYMYSDPYYYKFFFFLNFFVFFMIVLVLSNNIIFIFVGWEGIGIFSYLLINFWHTRFEANRSALKAILFNKIGDCFVYLFIVLYYFVFENFNLYLSKNLVFNYLFLNFYFFGISISAFSLLSICLVIAAAAKSAQLFLHVWLPDAMEGPTPVSALLHAATMVTAGVFLLLKFSWIIQMSLNATYFIILLGILTNFFASLTAAFQSDIKKIIAYSTASQLGLIFISFGLSKFTLALFHIFTHAFFKALLFLLAGVIIHFCYNKQDLRFFKNFNQFNILLVYTSFLVASLTLAALPFFSAYYSKDFFVQLSLLNISFFSYVIFFFLNFSVLTTAVYSYKILEYVFWNKKLLSFNNLVAKNNNVFAFVSIFVLTFFSIVSGYFFYNVFKADYLIFSENFTYNFNFVNFADIYYFEFTNLFILSLMFLGFFFGYYWIFFFNIFYLFFNKIIYKLFFFYNKKFFFDNIYFFFFKLFYKLLEVFYFVLDRTFIEFNINYTILSLKKTSIKTSLFRKDFYLVFFAYYVLFVSVINPALVVFFLIFFLKYHAC